MSRIKYPDKQKIRNQIDIILDKSELFNDSKDKTIHTSDKIVELKPVRQGIPVTKIIPVVVAVAAAVIFITTVNNYSSVRKDSYKRSQNPLATGSADGPDGVYVKDNDSTDAEIPQDSYQILYGNIESADISNIRRRFSSGASQIDGLTYQNRTDTLSIGEGTTLMCNVPVEMYYNNTRLYSVEERIYKAISDSLESYIASGKSDIYVTVTYTIDKDGMLTVQINQMPYDKLELDINTK